MAKKVSIKLWGSPGFALFGARAAGVVGAAVRFAASTGTGLSSGLPDETRPAITGEGCKVKKFRARAVMEAKERDFITFCGLRASRTGETDWLTSATVDAQGCACCESLVIEQSTVWLLLLLRGQTVPNCVQFGLWAAKGG